MIFTAGLQIEAQTRSSANKSLTGEYVSRNPDNFNMIWITELPKGRIHFCLQAGFFGPMGGPHLGFAQADVEVKNGRAVYLDNSHAEYKCTIVMKFSPGKAELNQDRGCGFANAVGAGGSYRRRTTKVPKDDLCKENGIP